METAKSTLSFAILVWTVSYGEAQDVVAEEAQAAKTTVAVTQTTTPAETTFDFSRFITSEHGYKEIYKGHPPGSKFVPDKVKGPSKHFRPQQYLNRVKQRWHPAMQDYCDPYHCEDYHKTACGMNNRTRTFKWFRSGCHLIMNNRCARYRGHLKYKPVDNTWCVTYAIHLRTGCPEKCFDVLDPICGRSRTTGNYVIFKNRCYFKKKNCDIVFDTDMNEYEETDASYCSDLLTQLMINGQSN